MRYKLFCEIMLKLADSPTGVTAGQVATHLQKQGRGVSKAQAKRALDELVLEGSAFTVRVKYRTNIDKVLYLMAEGGAIEHATIARTYMDNERQLALFMNEQGE